MPSTLNLLEISLSEVSTWFFPCGAPLATGGEAIEIETRCRGELQIWEKMVTGRDKRRMKITKEMDDQTERCTEKAKTSSP